MSDDLRSAISAALDEMTWDERIDAAVKVAKEFAAAEMRAVAHRLDDGAEEAAAVNREGPAYVHRVLCDCAHALDGKP